MLKRHEDILLARLDELAGRGWTFIAWWELYRWYAAERLARNTWRDFIRRMEETGLVDAYILESPEGLLLSTSKSMKSIRSKL